MAINARAANVDNAGSLTLALRNKAAAKGKLVARKERGESTDAIHDGLEGSCPARMKTTV